MLHIIVTNLNPSLQSKIHLFQYQMCPVLDLAMLGLHTYNLLRHRPLMGANRQHHKNVLSGCCFR